MAVLRWCGLHWPINALPQAQHPQHLSVGLHDFSLLLQAFAGSFNGVQVIGVHAQVILKLSKWY